VVTAAESSSAAAPSGEPVPRHAGPQQRRGRDDPGQHERLALRGGM